MIFSFIFFRFYKKTMRKQRKLPLISYLSWSYFTVAKILKLYPNLKCALTGLS